jgi:chlorobactene glucosyltransferase
MACLAMIRLLAAKRSEEVSTPHSALHHHTDFVDPAKARCSGWTGRMSKRRCAATCGYCTGAAIMLRSFQFSAQEYIVTSLFIEYAIFVGYVLAGPLIWVLFGIGMFAGRRRMALMVRPHPPLPDRPPRVTILVPAKDEGERIGDCLRSALKQTYPDFSVIAIDDRSVDQTGRIMEELSAADPRLAVIHIRDDQLPSGWTGKCNALHAAVGRADGQWLLLVDSDVVLATDALETTMQVALEKQCDAISLLPRLESQGFWEGLLVPLAGAATTALYLVALTNNDHKRRTAFANGQYLLIRRETYDQMGGHQRVRDRFCEDVEIARYLKANGKKVRISWGADFAAVRMYSSLASILRGWSRNFFAASLGRPWRILLGAAFIVLCSFSAYAAVAWGVYRLAHPVNAYGAYGWLIAGAAHLAIMLPLLAILYRWTGNAAVYALAFPLGGGMLLGIFARSIWMCITGKVEWRGTRYTHRMSADLFQARIG